MQHRLFSSYSSQILLVLFTAIAARLAFFAYFGAAGQILNNDASDYNRIALNLLGGYGFALDPGSPTAFRPFGYPWFLAFIYAIFPNSVMAVQCIQILLGSLVVIPTYQLGRTLFNPMTAVVASLGVALHPVLWYLTALIAPETIALLASMELLLLAYRLTEKTHRSGWLWLGCALTGAIAILMRPETLLLMLMLPLAHAVQFHREKKRLLILSSALFLAILLAILPPTVRNFNRFHSFIPMPTIGGVTFWGANNASVNGGWVMPTTATWPDDSVPASMRGWEELTEQASQDRFYNASFAWISQHPSDALRLMPKKLVRSWQLSFADETKASTLPPIVTLLNGIFGLIALLGLLVVFFKQSTASWLLAAPIAAWLIKTMAFYGSARQTALVLPIMCLSTGVLIAFILQRVFPTRQQHIFLSKPPV